MVKVNKSNRIMIAAPVEDGNQSYAVLGRRFWRTMVSAGFSNMWYQSIMSGSKISQAVDQNGNVLITHSPVAQSTRSFPDPSSVVDGANLYQPFLTVQIINPRLMNSSFLPLFKNLIHWTPSESEPLLEEDRDYLKKVPHIWGMSKWVTQTIKYALPNHPSITYMPCIVSDEFGYVSDKVKCREFMAKFSRTAVDIDNNKVVTEKDPEYIEWKKKGFVKPEQLDGAIILMTVASNTKDPCRKGLKDAVQAFAEFLVEYPNSYFYIHSSFKNPGGEAWWFDAEQLGILDRILVPRREFYEHNFYSDAIMRTLYNAATFYVYNGYGEGFLLPFVEAMACGVPAIGLEHTSVTEHCHPHLIVKNHPDYKTPVGGYNKSFMYRFPPSVVANKWVEVVRDAQENEGFYEDWQRWSMNYASQYYPQTVWNDHLMPFFANTEFVNVKQGAFDIVEEVSKWVLPIDSFE